MSGPYDIDGRANDAQATEAWLFSMLVRAYVEELGGEPGEYGVPDGSVQ